MKFKTPEEAIEYFMAGLAQLSRSLPFKSPCQLRMEAEPATQKEGETLGSFLRRIREERNLTQREVARITGYSESMIRAVENGRNAGSSRFRIRLKRFISDDPKRTLEPHVASGP